jgi:hypothetical protein
MRTTVIFVLKRRQPILRRSGASIVQQVDPSVECHDIKALKPFAWSDCNRPDWAVYRKSLDTHAAVLGSLTSREQARSNSSAGTRSLCARF